LKWSRLVFQFLVIGIELAYLLSKPTLKEDNWLKFLRVHFTKFEANKLGFWPSKHKSLIRQCLAPVLFAAIGVVLVSVTFSGRASANFAVTQCNTNVDADISGDGVRISIWAQVGTLIVISVIGVFHNYDTGIKEVGGGLILTHASLAIALMVQMTRGSLSSVDAAIGAIILDAQNMALQIPLTAKETLAARWQVILLIPTQIVGLVLVPILIVRLTNGNFASDDCKCLHVFWWSWLSDCSAFPSHELSVFWVYYTLRWVTFVQSTFHSLWNAPRFHEAEKSERSGTNVQKVEVVKSTLPDPYLYEQYPASISLTYTLHALFALTSMAVSEITIRDFQLRPSSQIYSVGQIIALVVAAATIVRAVWKFVRIFSKEELSFPNLFFGLLRVCCCGPRSKPTKLEAQWPFSFEWAKRIYIREESTPTRPDARERSRSPSGRTHESRNAGEVSTGERARMVSSSPSKAGRNAVAPEQYQTSAIPHSATAERLEPPRAERQIDDTSKVETDEMAPEQHQISTISRSLAAERLEPPRATRQIDDNENAQIVPLTHIPTFLDPSSHETPVTSHASQVPTSPEPQVAQTLGPSEPTSSGHAKPSRSESLGGDLAGREMPKPSVSEEIDTLANSGPLLTSLTKDIRNPGGDNHQAEFPTPASSADLDVVALSRTLRTIAKCASFFEREAQDFSSRLKLLAKPNFGVFAELLTTLELFTRIHLPHCSDRLEAHRFTDACHTLVKSIINELRANVDMMSEEFGKSSPVATQYQKADKLLTDLHTIARNNVSFFRKSWEGAFDAFYSAQTKFHVPGLIPPFNGNGQSWQAKHDLRHRLVGSLKDHTLSHPEIAKYGFQEDEYDMESIQNLFRVSLRATNQIKAGKQLQILPVLAYLPWSEVEHQLSGKGPNWRDFEMKYIRSIWTFAVPNLLTFEDRSILQKRDKYRRLWYQATSTIQKRIRYRRLWRRAFTVIRVIITLRATTPEINVLYLEGQKHNRELQTPKGARSRCRLTHSHKSMSPLLTICANYLQLSRPISTYFPRPQGNGERGSKSRCSLSAGYSRTPA